MIRKRFIMKYVPKQAQLLVAGKQYSYFSLQDFAKEFDINLQRLPFSIRVLLENLLRNYDEEIVKIADILAIANWQTNQKEAREIAYYPARVLMQDFTGVPCILYR